MSTAGDAALAIPDMINFTLGDPDLTTDRRILDAMYADTVAGKTHYTETLGEPEVREAICAHTAKHYGLDYSIEDCMITTSANHGMWLIMQTILNPGDEVLIIEPYFTPYPDQITMAQGVPVCVPTRAEDGFLPTRAAIEAVLSERTRAIIVNSPTNPTGAVWDDTTLEMVASIAVERDLIVLADDIYTIYDFARPFRSIATMPNMRERTVILHSFSKNYCMAGFRIGYLLGPAPLMNAARDINENVVFSAPTPCQRAALAALRHHDEVCPPIRQMFLDRLTVAAEEVGRTPKMHTPPPSGAIYLWVDIRETGMSSTEVADYLFDNAHVAVVPGIAFGASGEGFIRLAVTISENDIRAAFARIRATELFRD
ncbi:aminotransferase class I/II-fold pyridoxal phosphate-dependent enzyme [Nanchangia anserum]|uniref:Aminotransferase class I/II-fold pyridoxal phosphate-dependent enzyme n=2 Tax=Nanchangia anserum TaxID=2692125 RepID=A0A8I0KWH5_9ACTO|nr:aminotransferase class I/II-fold pyridoxal phosphate-dependent enzyme [Nanchangia anserum]QOX82564.1 aminotransferase class I/II-fold pyridoxal phosphate-dependent enzyme [Nanchangia anserum]